MMFRFERTSFLGQGSPRKKLTTLLKDCRLITSYAEASKSCPSAWCTRRDLRPEDNVTSQAKESCIRLLNWTQPSGWTSNGDIEAEALIEVVVSE